MLKRNFKNMPPMLRLSMPLPLLLLPIRQAEEVFIHVQSSIARIQLMDSNYLGSGSGSGSKALPNAQSMIAGGRIAKPLRGGGGTTSTTNKPADAHDQGNSSTFAQSPGNSKTHQSSS